MNRQEHLDWAKKRALEHVELGQLQQAVLSMLMDLSRHPDFALDLQEGLLTIGQGPEAVKRWIASFE